MKRRSNTRPTLADRILTLDEVLKRLGLSERTLYRLMAKNEIKAKKLGKRIVFEGLEVERFEQQ
jgi:excisionase family DNA binding protein